MAIQDEVISIEVLGKRLQVKCPHDKAETFQKAAYYFDSKMREIKDSGRATGNEHVAILAGLNVAFELMNNQQQRDLYLDTMGGRVKDLQQKIEQALAERSPLGL